MSYYKINGLLKRIQHFLFYFQAKNEYLISFVFFVHFDIVIRCKLSSEKGICKNMTAIFFRKWMKEFLWFLCNIQSVYFMNFPLLYIPCAIKQGKQNENIEKGST